MTRIWCQVFVLLSLSLVTSLNAAEKSSANQLTAKEIQEGWIQLFDGESLFGWKANNDVDWKVKDGVIDAATGDPGLLVTTTEFSDYELRCDFWMEKGGNSGVFLQSLFQPKDPTVDCYELNICDSRPKFGTGSLVGLVEPSKSVKGEDAWKTFHVIVRGTTIQVSLDGEQILEYTNPNPKGRNTGFIGLQKNSGHVQFRNVYLKPLKSRSLFNGKDLTGWRVVPGGTSKFTVQDGTIEVINGRGFLEAKETWADFILKSEIKNTLPFFVLPSLLPIAYHQYGHHVRLSSNFLFLLLLYLYYQQTIQKQLYREYHLWFLNGSFFHKH